ncbi:hypothetical protein BCO19218_01689 [Burkholderia contaminans]|nr:hypothetical protein BCO19218_01689 [Burkholderia contaminans]
MAVWIKRKDTVSNFSVTQDHFPEQRLLGFIFIPRKKAVSPLFIIFSNQPKVEEKRIFRALLGSNETTFQQRIIEATPKRFIVNICIKIMLSTIGIGN